MATYTKIPQNNAPSHSSNAVVEANNLSLAAYMLDFASLYPTYALVSTQL